MVTYHRWFILPMVEYTDLEGESPVTAPKYVHTEDRLDGYTSGGPFTRTEIENAGYSHLLAYNDAEEWRVVLVWGEGSDGWNALNEIHALHHDTETLADHQGDVKPVMDQRFGEGEWDIDAMAVEGSENTA